MVGSTQIIDPCSWFIIRSYEIIDPEYIFHAGSGGIIDPNLQFASRSTEIIDSSLGSMHLSAWEYGDLRVAMSVCQIHL